MCTLAGSDLTPTDSDGRRRRRCRLVVQPIELTGGLARAFGDVQAAGRHGIAGDGQSWSWAMDGWKLRRFDSEFLFVPVRPHMCLKLRPFCKIGIVALSFVFDKYCLIID